MNPTSSTTAAHAQPVIDAVHLDMATEGDRALQLDLLRLFVQQATRTEAAASGEMPGTERHVAIHAFRGAALAIGAGAAAEAAGRLEDEYLARSKQPSRAPGGTASRSAEALLAAARAARAEALRMIAEREVALP